MGTQRTRCRNNLRQYLSSSSAARRRSDRRNGRPATMERLERTNPNRFWRLPSLLARRDAGQERQNYQRRRPLLLAPRWFETRFHAGISFGYSAKAWLGHRDAARRLRSHRSHRKKDGLGRYPDYQLGEAVN